MGLIDVILNLAGVLLWLSWRSLRSDPLVTTSPATLVGTLRRAEPQRLKGWQLLAGLAVLLLLRALLYRQIGPAAARLAATRPAPGWEQSRAIGNTAAWQAVDSAKHCAPLAPICVLTGILGRDGRGRRASKEWGSANTRL